MVAPFDGKQGNSIGLKSESQGDAVMVAPFDCHSFE